MEPSEIKKAITEIGTSFEAFKAAQAENATKYDAVLEEKMSKIADDFTVKLEAVQQANAEMQAKLQRPAMDASDGKEFEKKTSQAFNQFLKKGAGAVQADFSDYINRQGLTEEFKALSVNSDPDGGFLVLPTFGGVVDVRVFETSPVRQLANVMTIGSDRLELVLDNDEASAGWVGEEAARPATNTPTFDKRIIPTHEMYAMPSATQKMLDDGIINVEQWLARKVADRFARLENTAFISGNGVAQPTGILTYTTTNTTYDPRNVQVINSGSSGAITYAGLVNLQNGLKEAYQSNATWMLKRATYGTLLKIVDGEQRPIFNLMFDANTGLPQPALMARPVVFGDDVPAVATDAKAIIYGDFRSAYTIVDRIGIRILRDPYTNKPFVNFYSTKRTGGDVVNAEALKIQALT
jgi:HK97 family phage major capsid protein